MFDLSIYADNVAAIADDGRRMSYAELKEASDKWAAAIPPRSLVFILAENKIESLVAYVGALNHGIVPLMLDAKIDKGLLERFIELYQPDFICRGGFIKTALPDGERARGTRAPTDGGRWNDRPTLFEELALLITTSGSTGAPKLVRQSYKNLRANAESIAEYLKIDATERPITTLPMNYVYGLSIINSHLIRGATILLTDKSIMQREFWNFFNEQGATSFGGVPYTYEMLDKLMFFRRKLPSLRTMTQAGGKILPELHKKFAEYAQREGKQFVVMYGASEATSRMSYLPPEHSLDKIGSMGIAIPGGRFELLDSDGSVIQESSTFNLQPSTCSPVGELAYYGDNVTLGYAECAADLAKGDERGGKLITGDMAKRDADGYYYIVGRKKRFLKIFGNRVNLDETERLLKSQFSDLDFACGGVDDKMKIFVCGEADFNAIREFVSAKTHLNFTAFEVVAIDKIPKNETGKTLYSELPK